MLNGEKWFVTSGDVAAVLIVMANVVDGEDRLPTLFLVDADAAGVEIVDNPRFTHSYPDGHPTIRFEAVEVPADAVIGGVGNGEELQRLWFTEERLGIAAHGIGAMWRLLDETVAWALEREQGGSRIYDYQGVSFPLADSATDAAAARLMTMEVARLADEGADPKLVHAKASMAKLFVSEAAWRCADRCVQVFGGRGYMRSNVAERLPARAAGRPDLGGHERDPAADRRPRDGAPWSRPGPPLRSWAARWPRSAPPSTRRPLLSPRSVAVVGASDRPGSYGDNVLQNLAAAGYDGAVWGVNPNRDEVHGRPCVAGVADLPEPVDAVVVAIPAPGVAPRSSREAIERGCGGAVVISAGFGEIEAGRGDGARADRAGARGRPPGLRAELRRDRLGRRRGHRSGGTRSSSSGRARWR